MPPRPCSGPASAKPSSVSWTSKGRLTGRRSHPRRSSPGLWRKRQRRLCCRTGPLPVSLFSWAWTVRRKRRRAQGGRRKKKKRCPPWKKRRWKVCFTATHSSRRVHPPQEPLDLKDLICLAIRRDQPLCMAQGGFPDQQAQSPIISVPESLVPGATRSLHPPGLGLLFLPSRTSVTSALLLQDPPESQPPSKPPLPPAKASGAPASCLALPAPTDAEQSLEHQALGPWAPSHSHRHVPPCARAGPPRGTSSLQKEAAAHELLSSTITLDGAGRKLGSSAEGVARVAFPAMPDAMEEPLDDKEEEEEEKEEEAPSPQCPSIPDEDHLSRDPVRPGEALQAKNPGDPEGTPLFANGTAGDQAAALRLATRLYHLDGFKRSQVAAFLQKNNEFSQKVAEAYFSFFEFSQQTLDQALRSFLKVFVLTGETQERERILWHFSQRYHRCNPQAFQSPDAVHTLTCALMLLNTDLHGQNIGRIMSCQAFLVNLEGLNDGQNFPKELLKALYYSIRQEKLEWAVDEGETEVGAKQLQRPSASGGSFSSQKKSNPFMSLAHDPGAQTYRQGLLARKVHAEADGKKTPWGKRGWKIFHTVLKGMVLYFFKEESRSEGMGTEEPLGVHHALAEPASKYTKRPHVFWLQTADWRVFLFQAPSAEEMSSWISRINLVAAMFSSPPFPAAVGSQRKFFRPILPTAPCKNSLEEQHEAHESCLDKASEDLLELQRNLPDKRGARGRDLEEYRLKKEYLLYEKRRYETYVRLLEVKLSSSAAEEDLDQWEARLGKSEAEGSCPSLQKSHSSPSLNAEGPAAATVKVKRNISERRTVRRIIPRRNKHLL
ncbi:PH and SEC7 domain-containing protein 1 isoform X2 [Pogona vitticeps]